MKSLDYREAEPSDLRFIEKSFLSSFRTSHSAGLVSMESWEEMMGPEWRKILQRPNVRGIVAYRPGETSESASDLYGFIVYETGYQDRQSGKQLPYVVFLYIKSSFRRRFDIEAGLFDAAGIDPTKPFHYAVKTPNLSRNQHFRKDQHRPLFVRFPTPKSNPERLDLDR